MKLKIILPEKVLLEAEVRRITVEAVDGSMGILPRHVNFVTALTPGILTYIKADGREAFAALDEGILLKNKKEIRISVQNGVKGAELGQLEQAVREFITMRDQLEERSSYALALMEADFLRRFVEMD